MSEATAPVAGGNTLVSLLGNLLRHRRLLVLGMLMGFVIAVAGVLLRPPSYTSRASFMPQAARNSELSRLSGLAGQFGVNIGGSQPIQAPYFYVDLLHSREILGAAVDSTYALPADGGRLTADLTTIYESEGGTPAERREDAIRELRKAISTPVLLKSGLVVLNVQSRNASLSQQIGNRLLRQLDQFNLETRQSQASAERRFVEARLKDRQAELQQSEERLRRFLEENRDYRASPRLSFEADRLQRDVAMRQQLVTSLAESHEQARIDEVRDTPIIVIVEPPDLPVDADRGHLFNKAVVGVLLGGLLGFGIAMVLEFFRAHPLQELRQASPGPRRPPNDS